MNDRADRLYERVLVLRCQTGDEAAFAELVERYTRRLRYFVRKLLSNADNADDVVQEVWMIVFRKIADLNEPDALATWLYRIARNRAYRSLRGRVPLQLPVDESELVDDNAADDEFAAADADRIHAGLDELPTDQREVLTLRFLEQMTYEEIAGVTDCKLGTVRSRIHYAKRALRRAIERSPDDE